MNSDTEGMMGDDYRELGQADRSCRRNVFCRGSSGKEWRDSRGDRQGRRNRPIGEFPATEELRIARYGQL